MTRCSITLNSNRCFENVISNENCKSGSQDAKETRRTVQKRLITKLTVHPPITTLHLNDTLRDKLKTFLNQNNNMVKFCIKCFSYHQGTSEKCEQKQNKIKKCFERASKNKRLVDKKKPENSNVPHAEYNTAVEDNADFSQNSTSIGTNLQSLPTNNRYLVHREEIYLLMIDEKLLFLCIFQLFDPNLDEKSKKFTFFSILAKFSP